MLFRDIIVDAVVVDDYRIDGVAREPYVSDSMEIVDTAVYRLEMWRVCLPHHNGVEEVIGLHDEYVLIPEEAHWQGERVGIDLLIDDDRIAAITCHR